MFVIFGWAKLKSGEQFLTTYCTQCQRNTIHKAFTQQSWFTLFFIPILPIGAKHPHAVCNICGQDVHDKISVLGARTTGEAQPPAIESLPVLQGDEAVVRLTWWGMYFAVGMKFSVTFDGSFVDKVSILKPYFKEIRTSPGSHVLEVKVPMRRPKKYTLLCPRSGYYSVVLEYSRTWGNFVGTCKCEMLTESAPQADAHPPNLGRQNNAPPPMPPMR